MLVPALVALSVASGAPTCKTADPRIETLIASYARKTKSDEYCQARLYHTIDDLDGDGNAWHGYWRLGPDTILTVRYDRTQAHLRPRQPRWCLPAV